jgi:hypothetical protein
LRHKLEAARNVAGKILSINQELIMLFGVKPLAKTTINNVKSAPFCDKFSKREHKIWLLFV